jgi:putative spermidine/putrescine transport system permease protein
VFETRQIGRRVRQSERRRQLQAILLLTPLILFLVVFFLLPIAGMLLRSIENDELREVMPATAEAIAAWDGTGLPSETVFATFARELAEARTARTLAIPAKRLNYDLTGFRSLMFGSARKLPDDPPPDWRAALIEIDPAWGETRTWQAIARAAEPLTGFYLLTALDLKFGSAGEIVRAPPNEAIYLDILLRTFWIAAVVTGLCLALGFPLAYKLAHLDERISNLLMIFVLLPFWTSLLVRTTAWVVLLQREGPINDLLRGLGLIDDPLQLIYNRFGVYVAMTHILLPFMVLPLYSVMKGIPPALMRAAAGLGAPPATVFRRIYLPLALPGVAAGCLLVFILAIGYYITPALVGGANDQLVSYFVAFFTNQTVNWGMAAALGTILLLAVLVLYTVYARLVGTDRLKLA